MEERKVVINVNAGRDKSRDKICWATIFLLVTGGVIASYYFRETVWSLRLIGWLLLLGVSLGLAFLTSQGKSFFVFLDHATKELRKVVWPTQDETMKITAVVAALVFAMSIILWILDTFLLWIFSWLTK